MADRDRRPDTAVGRLERLGRAAPPPSTHLLDRLTADRLTADRLDQPVPAPARRRPVRLPVLLPVAAVAALLIGFVLVAVGHDDPGGRAVVLDTAVDAGVEVAGRVTPLRAGQSLADGTVVVTGRAGSVTAGGRIIGPGERAVVRGGRLERLIRRRARAGDGAAGPTPFASVTIGVTLDVTRTAAGAPLLRWTPYAGDDFGAYVVAGGDHRVVVRRDRVGATRAVDRRAGDGPARYVVVVFDVEGRPVARSRFVSG